MPVADIESRLDEWSRWCRQDFVGPFVQTRCGSAEGRFLPEAGDVFDDTREPHPPLVPDHVALPVERAVLALPDPFRSILVLFYVRRMPEPVLHRYLRRWRVRDPRIVLDEGRQRVAAALR